MEAGRSTSLRFHRPLLTSCGRSKEVHSSKFQAAKFVAQLFSPPSFLVQAKEAAPRQLPQARTNCRKFALSLLIGNCRATPPCTAAGNRAGGQAMKGPGPKHWQLASPSLRPQWAPLSQLLVTPTTEVPHPAHHTPGTRFCAKSTAAAPLTFLSASSRIICLSRLPLHCRLPGRNLLSPSKLPARGNRRVQFCAAPLCRPQPLATSLAQLSETHCKPTRMVYDGHR